MSFFDGISLPARYAEALGARDPIEALAGAPDRLAARLAEIDDADLRRRPAPGKWTVHEIVGHLADHEVILGARLRLVAGLDRPSVLGYDQDALVARLGLDRATTPGLLEDFRVGRAVTVRFLQRLPERAWRRVGLHTERGEESIAAMVALYAAHDLIHEEQIERTLASLA